MRKEQETGAIGIIVTICKNHPRIASVLAIFGYVLYLVQAWFYAHIQTSFINEGGFLYLGELFVKGVIRPFQDFGSIRQYAPLAYLIPGQIDILN